MVSLRVHNVLDYVIGAILIACPFLFGFSDIDAARRLFLTLGFGLIGYSLLTNYTYSLLKLIPVAVHMVFDVLAGMTLILGSYLFGYRDLLTGGQTALHYLLGLGAILLVSVTRTGAGRGTHVGGTREGEPPIDIRRRSA
jgi:hypothetical protein